MSTNRLVISALSDTAKSILLPSTILFDKRKVVCVSLVDSGCTALAFIDYKFAVRHQLPLMQLQKKRPLFLADGGLSSWVEFATETELMVGDHWKQLQYLHYDFI